MSLFSLLNLKLVAIKKLLFLVFCVLSFFAHSQSNDYIVKKKLYTQLDGLPDRKITCGLEDQNGFLWFGTKSGLCRFDGKKFLILTRNSHGLHDNNVIDIAKHEDKLVITYGIHGSAVKPLKTKQVLDVNTLKISSLKEAWNNIPFKQEQILSVFNTTEGTLGFLTESPNAIWLVSGNAFQQKFNNATVFQSHFINEEFLPKVYMNKRNCVISSLYSLHWLQEGSSRAHLIPHAARFLFTISEHQVTFGQRNLRNDINYLTYSSIDAIPETRRTALKRENETKWFEKIMDYLTHIENSTLVTCRDGSNWLYLHTNELIPLFDNNEPNFPKQILSVVYFRDSRGTYWVCSSEGVIRLTVEKNKFQTYFTKEHPLILKNNSTRGIYAKGDTLCVNMLDYFAYRYGDREEKILHSNIGNYSFMQLQDNQSELWIGSSLLKKFDFRKNLKSKLTKNIGREIWGLYELNESEILLCTTVDFFLYNVNSNDLKRLWNYEKTPYPQPHFIYKCIETPRKELMAVAGSGLYILNERAEIIDYYGYGAKEKKKKFPFVTIHDVFIDKNGIYWIATDGEGLFRWNRDEHSFRNFGIENGFISNVTYCIQEDDFNNLWISTGLGLSRFNKKTHKVKNYTTTDGIADNEFNRISQFKAQDGRIYFGGLNGVTSFHPVDFVSDTIVKTIPFRITDISVSGKEKEVKQITNVRQVLKKGLTLHPDIQFFSITFSLLDYEDRTYSYAYKIEGIDKDWMYSNENTLRYGNLPYGNYKLRIKAQTINGYWNPQEIVIPLTILMPFYKTWWFLTLIALAFIGIVSLIAFIIFRQRLQHLKTMNNLRLRLTSDLHDEVGGLLNKTSLQSELAREEVSEGTKILLDKIAENSRKALSGMRDIMWNIDPRNDSLEDLFNRMKEYAMEMLGDDFDYSVTTKKTEEKQLKQEVKQSVYLIFKEAVNNIVKHAKKGKVEIIFTVTKKEIFLSFYNESDFVKKEISAGQGLKNMKMRTEKLRGTFQINRDKGVQIEVHIPLD
jgi:hypothetical protein